MRCFICRGTLLALLMTGRCVAVPPAQVTFVYPKEGDKTRDIFDVQIHIQTPEPSSFSDNYRGCSLCLSLDDSAFSCWPIFNIQKLPRFVGVRDGAHALVGMIKREGQLMDASRGEIRFTSSAREDPPALPTEPQQPAPDAAPPPQEEGPREQVSIPTVSIQYPQQLTTVGRGFDVTMDVQTSEDQDKFRRLFDNGYMCLSLDNAANSCWPMFVDDYFPSYVNVRPGRHTLVAHLSHPESGQLVAGSSQGFTTFYSQDDGGGSHTVEVELTPNGLPQSGDAVVHVVLDGKAVPFIVSTRDDAMARARDFCTAHNIQGQACAEQLVRRLEEERRAAQEQ